MTETPLDTMNTNVKRINTNILFRELSYQVQGAFYAVANKYGKGLKEKIYQEALAEEFSSLQIPFEREKRISIYSEKTGKILGSYIPDFVVDGKIIVEIKATEFTIPANKEQQLSYLKSSNYELGYLVNFCTPKLYIHRSIYSNNRKPHSRLFASDSRV